MGQNTLTRATQKQNKFIQMSTSKERDYIFSSAKKLDFSKEKMQTNSQESLNFEDSLSSGSLDVGNIEFGNDLMSKFDQDKQHKILEKFMVYFNTRD
jgi:hypothetical protein